MADNLEKPIVSIIIVSYNTWHYLESCIESIYTHFKDLTYEIIVVDNASTDESQTLIIEKFPEIHLIANNANAGFAKANNQALEVARGEYLFLLNADTVIQNSAINQSLQFMLHNDVSILGPKLINEDGSLQVSFQKKNDISNYILNIFSLSLHINKFRKPYKAEILEPERVEFLVGAALLLRKDHVRLHGLFDESFYFTCEERDLCLRFKEAGKRIFYYPKLVILHYGGSGDPHSTFHIINWINASLSLVKKHGRTLDRILMRIGFTIYLLSYLIVFTSKAIFSKDKAYSKRQMQNYYKAIKLFFVLESNTNLNNRSLD